MAQPLSSPGLYSASWPPWPCPRPVCTGVDLDELRSPEFRMRNMGTGGCARLLGALTAVLTASSAHGGNSKDRTAVPYEASRDFRDFDGKD